MQRSLSRTLQEFLAKDEAQIVLTSFLVLFLELSLIRWLSANILYLAFFANLVLLASFFGMGLGLLLADRRSLLPFLPYTLFLAAMAALPRLYLSVSSPDMVSLDYVKTWYGTIPAWAVLPGIFVIVAGTFLGLGQRLGELFRKADPLIAYGWDVFGSILGIAAFSLSSWCGAGPVAWFSVAAAVFFVIDRGTSSRQRAKQALAFAATIGGVAALSFGALWSPYYKITVKPLGDPRSPSGYTLYANETGNQSLERPEAKEWIYATPYGSFKSPRYENVLIIGAGGGSDVAMALKNGVGHVDAVEIDPMNVALGKKLHPSRPYDDPRVDVTIADGRTFLERTGKKYDLIIFALTDSLALASNVANTRLESYLFTREAFTAARARLNDDGLLVLYNYYREPWLVEKIAGMVEGVFGEPPYVIMESRTLASIMAGPKLRDLRPDAGGAVMRPEAYPPATDEWPFLYLKAPGVPRPYVAITAILLLIVAFMTRAALKGSSSREPFPWAFFFLGAGFLLLETKNVINFQLLFGATWAVNALVFAAVLVMVLLAIGATRAGAVPRTRVLYAALGAVLVLNLIVPLRSLAALPLGWRYAIASTLTLSPIFFANLIFSRYFRRARHAHLCLAANLLGAMVGGFSEFASMRIGYHQLVAVALFFYGAALVTAGRTEE